MTSLRFYTHPKFHLETALKYLPLGSTTVYGTLARPSGSSRSGPFPAVVMVAGSGPTDRDWNSPLLPGTHGSARLLAETLAQAGIASLRYDKRATGPHMGENMPTLIGKMSMQSHLDEPAGAVHTLAGQADIRKDKIFSLANVDVSACDFSTLDQIMPHPDYSPQHYICVLNPSDTTFDKLRILLGDAYDLAVRRHAKRTKS